MDDIVTRLRKYQSYNKPHGETRRVMREAAAEIERLRAKVLMLADQQHFNHCIEFGCPMRPGY